LGAEGEGGARREEKKKKIKKNGLFSENLPLEFYSRLIKRLRGGEREAFQYLGRDSTYHHRSKWGGRGKKEKGRGYSNSLFYSR